MKSLVIYKSKTGFTEKYANWISNELNCDIKKYEDVSKNLVNEYDLIIYGAGVYAGKIGGLDKIKKLGIRNNKLIVFASGATPIEAGDTIDRVWKSNFSEEEIKEIPHYYMPGGISYERMAFFSKLVIKALSKMLKKNKEMREKSGNMDLEKSYDSSSKEYIKPLVEFVRKSF